MGAKFNWRGKKGRKKKRMQRPWSGEEEEEEEAEEKEEEKEEKVKEEENQGSTVGSEEGPGQRTLRKAALGLQEGAREEVQGTHCI